MEQLINAFIELDHQNTLPLNYWLKQRKVDILLLLRSAIVSIVHLGEWKFPNKKLIK